MPYIKFAFTPRKDAERVAKILGGLEAVALAHDVTFYVNAREEEESEPVVATAGVELAPDVLARLRELAAKADVTIYVHPGD